MNCQSMITIPSVRWFGHRQFSVRASPWHTIDATQLLAAMIFRLTRQSVSHSFVISSGLFGTPTFG